MFRRNVTTKDFVIAGLFVAILLFVVYPAVSPGPMHWVREATTCQSNLNKVGKAIQSYMTDWNDTFPTNRLNAKGSPIANTIPLSDDPEKRFQHGVNWVEALYPYTAIVADRNHRRTMWTCPMAKRSRASQNTHRTDAVTYAINMNLLEQPLQAMELLGSTMLIREMDRRCGAVCRPANISKDKLTRPKDPFLTDKDSCLGPDVRCEPLLHGQGSHILFADGHVKSHPAHAMIEPVWDSSTQRTGGRWWNSTKPERQFIAITP